MIVKMIEEINYIYTSGYHKAGQERSLKI